MPSQQKLGMILETMISENWSYQKMSTTCLTILMCIFEWKSFLKRFRWFFSLKIYLKVSFWQIGIMFFHKILLSQFFPKIQLILTPLQSMKSITWLTLLYTYLEKELRSDPISWHFNAYFKNTAYLHMSTK